MLAFHVRPLVARLVLVALLATVGPVQPRAQRTNDLANLADQVSQLYSQGKFAEAIPIAERLVALARQTQGENHSIYATASSLLASLYRIQGPLRRGRTAL